MTHATLTFISMWSMKVGVLKLREWECVTAILFCTIISAGNMLRYGPVLYVANLLSGILAAFTLTKIRENSGYMKGEGAAGSNPTLVSTGISTRDLSAMIAEVTPNPAL